jgi:8-oxo-dGTP diphosphatase
MEQSVTFIYKKEYWFISAFINSSNLKLDEIIVRFKKDLLKKLNNLTLVDLKKISWNPQWVSIVKEMGESLSEDSFNMKWVPYVVDFPYYDENQGIKFNTLGYFEFSVEYFKKNPEKKETINPNFLQQIPAIVQTEFKTWSQLKINENLYMDTNSPMYICACSDNLKPNEIEWTKDNIKKHSHSLAYWTELYSGQWPDYNEALYEGRVANNLSNRLSELHFVRRNSGFIFMNKKNFEMFFDTYMKEAVLATTAQIRAMQFGLTSINESLDIVFVRTAFMDIKELETKITSLKMVRATIQTQLSVIYNELDYNRRQHYTNVLTHLVKELNIENILERMNKKFDIINDNIEMLYQQKDEENANDSERRMSALSLLFGMSVLADLAGLIAGALGAEVVALDTVLSIIIIGFLTGVISMFVKSYLKSKVSKEKHAVDAVIIDDKDNIVLVKRKYPPFKGKWALPGGFVDHHENLEHAVSREVKEETCLEIEVLKEIGIYDKPGRDPRGTVISNAFLCKIKTGTDFKCLKGGDDAGVAQLVPLKSLEGLNLAFDHEDILSDALKLRK